MTVRMTPDQSHATGAAGGESVIKRAFRLLDVFVEPGRPLSLTSMSVQSGIPKSTVLRLARTMVALGVLERLPNGNYTIGLRLLEIATLAPRGQGIRTAALPFMHELHAATSHQVLLGVPTEAEVVLVERLSRGPEVASRCRVGGRLPLHQTALGRVLLANAPPSVQNLVLARLACEPQANGTCPDELRRLLAKIRHDGVAVMRCANQGGWLTVAGPVFNGLRDVVASLAVMAPLSGSGDVIALRGAVVATCQAISRSTRTVVTGRH